MNPETPLLAARIRIGLCHTARWAACAALMLTSGFASAVAFVEHNLVSDLPGEAAVQDANLVNPWGLAFNASGPFWVANNGSATSTVYGATGHPFPAGSPLVVSVPGAPTGVRFNDTGAFSVGGKAAAFLFASEDGTVSGWAGGSQAQVVIDQSASQAVYKGLALGVDGGIATLYAANFHSGAVDKFGPDFSARGSFTDPTLPAGYAPFDVQNIGGKLYVTFALQDSAKHDDVAGAGHGFIDEFNPDGSFVRRFASQGALNSPWGMAVVPSGAGPLAGDLLVGNFGDGRINAFNLGTGMLIGPLSDAHNQPIEIPGLWSVAFGNGGLAGAVDTLFFTAGIPGPNGAVEDHGLFGSLQRLPEPTPLCLFTLTVPLLLWLRFNRVPETHPSVAYVEGL